MEQLSLVLHMLVPLLGQLAPASVLVEQTEVLLVQVERVLDILMLLKPWMVLLPQRVHRFQLVELEQQVEVVEVGMEMLSVVVELLVVHV